MYKEVKFKDQEGWGLTVTQPGTRTRALVGIFETFDEADRCGRERKARRTALNPRVVEWTKRIYNKYDYVFNK